MTPDDAKPANDPDDRNLGDTGDKPAAEPEGRTDESGEGEGGEETLAAQLEQERQLKLQGLERERQVRQRAEAAERRLAEIEMSQRASAPTTQNGASPQAIRSRLEELREQATKPDGKDAAIVVAAFDRAEQATRDAQLARYSPEDQQSLRVIIERHGVDVPSAEILLDGYKARYERDQKAQASGAVQKAGERRVAEAQASKPKPAATSVRPVGAGEVKAITKMTWADFAKRMDSMDPNSKEARQFVADTENGKINLVPD